MIVIIFELFLFIRFVKPEPNLTLHEGNTTLAMKKGIKDYAISIPVATSNFKEMICKKEIFIDNTLFLKEILLDSRTSRMAIFCPSQWGKTTLLTMVQTFLQIQVDEQGKKITPKESTNNYKLFKHGEILHEDGTIEQLQTPLMIANDEVSMQYQGRYPVIYLTFKDAFGATYDEIERNISLAVHKAFKQHEYLMKTLNKQDLEQFKHYLLTTERFQFQLGSLAYSLDFLDNLFKRYFGRNCFLLIDDYDTPLHSFLHFVDKFCYEDEKYYFSIFESFITTFVNRSKYKRVILMGTFSIRSENYQKLMMAFISENYIGDESQDIVRSNRQKFRQYFGFKEQQVKFLFDLYNISAELAQQAKNWYNGYQSESSQHTYYHPASITKFLSHKEIACYRPLNKYTAFIQKTLVEEPETRTRVLKLISKQPSPQFSISSYMYTETGWDLRSYHHFQHRTVNINYRLYKTDMIFEAILWTEDYLTGTSQIKNNTLPNNEVAFLMSTWLITYYKRRYNIDDNLLDNAANALLDYIKSERSKLLKESLEQLYKDSLPNITHVKPGMDDPFYAVLHCIVLRMQCITKFQLDIYYDKVKTADIVIYDDQRQQAIVIQLCTNQLSARSAYFKANKISKDLKLPSSIRRILKIGLNISANKSISISSKADAV